jgi:fibrillarin-like pre-rRNA processing protein
MKQTNNPGIYEIKKKNTILLTKNLVPGKKVYTEDLIREGEDEYRTWDPMKSKLAAALLKGLKSSYIKPGDFVLYLGASTGTTSSHVSDILGEDGFVYALDFAPRVVRNLVFVCKDRKNMAPLLADANKPESYTSYVSPVEVVYQDIAQRDQVGIFIKNIEMYLKIGGYGLLVIKARSVDVTKKPRQIFDQVRKELSEKYHIVDEVILDPFERDHCMFVIKK